ncbi:MAG: hypothetical protein AAB778_04225 [Patescibacteria group bacterium]
MRKNIITLALFTIFIIILYFPIFNNFFQQDEWSAFANIYIVGYREYILNALIPDPGHYVPFARILLAVYFKMFQLDYWKWALVSVIWHISNSFLVYVLARKIFKENWQAFSSGILFALFAAGQQATSWVVADGATHGATFFILLSIILFFESKIWLSLLMLLFSLLFKEIAVGIFAFFPLLIIVKNYLEKKKIFDIRILYFIVVAIFYVGFRYLTFLGIFSNITAPIITESQTANDITYNIATFPIKGISQIIIPQYILLETSKFIAIKLPDGIAGLPGTNFFDNFYLKYVFESLVYFVFVIISIIMILLLKFKRNKMVTIATFGLIFAAINSMIYALSPGRSSFIPIIDSRNLYLPSIGIIFFIVGIASLFKNWKLSYIFILIFTIFNFVVTKIELTKISNIGSQRQNILNQITQDNLLLKDKQIFYIESDTSYYGLPDEIRILPFQSGFGQTLLVWFSNQSDFPKDLYKDQFLWDLKSQGYKEVGNRGFGYFRELNLLKSTLSEYNLSIESVVAYSWDSKEEKLTNITEAIRSKLKGDKKR